MRASPFHPFQREEVCSRTSLEYCDLSSVLTQHSARQGHGWRLCYRSVLLGTFPSSSPDPTEGQAEPSAWSYRGANREARSEAIHTSSRSWWGWAMAEDSIPGTSESQMRASPPPPLAASPQSIFTVSLSLSPSLLAPITARLGQYISLPVDFPVPHSWCLKSVFHNSQSGPSIMLCRRKPTSLPGHIRCQVIRPLPPSPSTLRTSLPLSPCGPALLASCPLLKILLAPGLCTCSFSPFFSLLFIFSHPILFALKFL